MKTLVWIWVFLSVFKFCNGQNEIDSLRGLLHSSNLSQKAHSDVTARLAWLFSNQSQSDSALLYYRKALAGPYQDPNRGWWAAMYSGIGSCHIGQGRLDSAAIYYRKALSDFKKVNDQEQIALTSISLSAVFRNQGLYEEALQQAIFAMKIFESRGPSNSLAQCYNTTAIIYAKIKIYSEAATYYRKAIGLFKKTDSANLAKSYNNLGWLFTLTHQYDSARVNLTRAANLKRHLNDTKGLARTINNLGKVSILTGDLAGAAKELGQSFAIQQEVDDPSGMIEVLNNLGELSLLKFEYKRSERYLLDAEKVILKTGTPEYLRQNLELQVRLARARKDYANGMLLMDRLMIIRDSLLNDEKTKSLQAMHIRYQTEKKEQQIALLQQQEEISVAKIRNGRMLIGALVVGLLLVAAIGTLIYVNLRNARAAKARIELLLAETRHRIKNNLQTLASIFHLQTRHYTDHEMVLEARSSESRVHAMSILHEKFYNAEADHIINTRAYITDLVYKLVDIYGVRARQLRLSLHVDEIELDIDKALALSLIIQELVCNAFKYAFDHRPDPHLTVSIRLRRDEVVATVKDNGIGLNDYSIQTSHGFSLVDALVTQLDGKMEYDNSDGTTFIIQFPTTQWKKRLFS
jgi:two-component sensor histidine kinase/tetratricopeptide (TPR) repeat protein